MDRHKFNQLQGPFDINKNIFNLLNNFSYTEKVGIQSKPGTICTINKKEFEIGKTGILEFEGIRITSLSFNTPVGDNTLVDFIL